jgi:hypothetical protein
MKPKGRFLRPWDIQNAKVRGLHVRKTPSRRRPKDEIIVGERMQEVFGSFVG